VGTVNTDVKNVIFETEQNSQYDEKAKKVLGNKQILAQIIVNTVEDFKNMNPQEVIPYIEGEPIISRMPVDPGMTNVDEEEPTERITGSNTEDTENKEGMVRFDVVFYVRLRDGRAQIIINVESQKDDPTEYHIINRTVYYACRLISSQKDRDFINQKYNDIKRVYTIWVCMDAGENCLNHIHLTNDSLLGNHKWKGRTDLLNIFLIGLSGKLPEAGNDKYKLHRFLGTVFSDSMTTNEKINLLESEYKIPMEQQLKEGLDNMCNLSQGIVERTTKRVTESVTKSVTESVTASVTASVTESVTANVTTELSTEHTIAIMDSLGISVDEAMGMLKVAEKDRESLKAAVEARLAQGAVAN
jgi:hypothetical protein